MGGRASAAGGAGRGLRHGRGGALAAAPTPAAAAHSAAPTPAAATSSPPCPAGARRGHRAARAAGHRPAPPANPIPQGNGGDQDADNNGGPSDGDGNI